MITITPNADGRVMRVGYHDKALPKGAIEVAEIPQEPTLAEGKACELWWTGTALEWRIYDAPPMPVEEYREPTYEEPTEPTNEELAEERKRAYEAECDQYLIAYQGYLLEGNLEAAENCKQAYLAKKREIRARISCSTVDPVQNVTETPASEPESVQIPLSGDDDLL